jgi:hypothetical protein
MSLILQFILINFCYNLFSSDVNGRRYTPPLFRFINPAKR